MNNLDVPAIVTVAGNMRASAKTLDAMCLDIPPPWANDVASCIKDTRAYIDAFEARFLRDDSNV